MKSTNRKRLDIRLEAFEAGIARIGYAICRPLNCAMKNSCTRKTIVKSVTFCKVK